MIIISVTIIIIIIIISTIIIIIIKMLIPMVSFCMANIENLHMKKVTNYEE